VNADIQRALAYCRQVTRQQAKNFYYAFLFLPSDKRAAVYSVYAFCRHSDDIADAPGPLHYKRDQLKHWRDELENCYSGSPTRLVTRALGHTIRKYPIPRRYFEELLTGVEMDLTVQRYASFDDLKVYCYRVASAVGLACLEIFGYRHDGVRTYAGNLGIALQLTNILRDVREDAERGRIYLPQEDLLAFGVTENDVLRQRYTESFATLMRFQQDRILAHYRIAASSLLPGDRAGLMAPEIMAAIYRATLHKMQRRGFNVFRGRTRLSGLRKICIGLGTFLSLCIRDGWPGQPLAPTASGKGEMR
jgi:phytoene synthase